MEALASFTHLNLTAHYYKSSLNRSTFRMLSYLTRGIPQFHIPCPAPNNPYRRMPNIPRP